MPNATSVTLVNGVPTAPSGTVSTIDALMALIGEVQASPTANTALDRLKAILTQLSTGGVHIDTTQLATLATAYTTLVLSGGGNGSQSVWFPTDQPVPNKVQVQSNGMTSSRVVAAASTNATNLKASNGAIGEIDVFNVAAYDVFLKIYNKASSPTVGTDTPVWTVPIKAGTGYSRHFPRGKWLGTGVSYAITKLQADSDTTVLVAGDLTGSIDWI